MRLFSNRDVERRVRALREQVRAAEVVKLVLGAAHTRFEGWLSTGIESLDVTDTHAWEALLGPRRAQAMLAEHVIEHLTPEGLRAALQSCYAYLEPGGHFRIAVPDGNHPDPRYVRAVRPGGTGEGAFDHKHLFTIETLGEALSSAGFEVRPVEWFDAKWIRDRLARKLESSLPFEG